MPPPISIVLMLCCSLILDYGQKSDYNGMCSTKDLLEIGGIIMAMIKCPECGKEISDTVKKCPNCGFSLKKEYKKKGKKVATIFIAILAVIIVVVGILYIRNLQTQKREHQQEIAALNMSIQDLAKGEIPSQEAYDSLVELYNGLSEEDKNMIEDTSVFDKYKDIDLDKISAIANKISSIDDNSKFSSVLELQEEYTKLDSNEKAFVDNSKLESVMQLNDIEKAALSACKNVRSCMISSDSFQIKDITVKDDLEKMNFYWVLIRYSGTNSFGATLDKTSCFGIDADFTDPFFGLAQITGYDQYLDSTTSYLEYSKCGKQEVSVDVDKITYYLNK